MIITIKDVTELSNEEITEEVLLVRKALDESYDKVHLREMTGEQLTGFITVNLYESHLTREAKERNLDLPVWDRRLYSDR